MKEKKIRKIANYIVDLVKQENTKSESPRSRDRSPSKQNSDSIEYCELESDVSKKFTKFIKSLLNQKSEIQLEITENYLNITYESNPNPTGGNWRPAGVGVKPPQDKDFEIKIDRNGLRFRRDRAIFYNFNNKTLFEELRPLIIQKNKELSNFHLNEAIDQLTLELNLSRENNLDEILS